MLTASGETVLESVNFATSGWLHHSAAFSGLVRGVGVSPGIDVNRAVVAHAVRLQKEGLPLESWPEVIRSLLAKIVSEEERDRVLLQKEGVHASISKGTSRLAARLPMLSK